MVLELRGVTKAFGGLKAVSDVSFSVPRGRIKGVIGPNGAGKTTLFNMISGMLPVSGGSIHLNGEDVTRVGAVGIAKRGLSRNFQQPKTFRSFTVLENVLMGREWRCRSGFVAGALNLPSARAEGSQAERLAREQLEFAGLADLADRVACELPLGQQRYVEIARSLNAEPHILLLDEPAAGLNDTETEELAALLRRVRDRGVTLLLIEHHMKFVMSLCDDIVVLNFGEKIMDGPPSAVRASPKVIEAYLGGSADHV